MALDRTIGVHLGVPPFDRESILNGDCGKDYCPSAVGQFDVPQEAITLGIFRTLLVATWELGNEGSHVGDPAWAVGKL